MDELKERISGWLNDDTICEKCGPEYRAGYKDALLRVHRTILMKEMDTYDRREEIARMEREKLYLERKLNQLSDYLTDLWVADDTED